MAIQFNLTQGENSAALTVLIDGEVRIATQDHPAWNDLVNTVLNRNDDSLDTARFLRLFDPGAAVVEFFESLSERVTMSGGHLFVDNDEVNDSLAQTILRYINEGNDAGPLLNFLEKVLTNPNEHSREQLYDWLSRYDFAINEAGNFLAYKGVYERTTGDDLDTYPYQSSSSGKAIVDGTPYSGQIPNGVGATVEMPRGEVAHDPSVGCHTGLHAGTWEYASTFTRGPVLLVEINPRDVVSVPTDCDWQKIRTCRYTVVDVIDKKVETAYYGEEVDESEDDQFDEDESGDNWCEACQRWGCNY